MKRTLHRLSASMASVFSFVFKDTKKQSDLEKLTRHIMELNKKQSVGQIVDAASVCLKDILDHRFLAFVIQNRNKVDVRTYPGTCSQVFEKLIMKDFVIEDRKKLVWLNHCFVQGGVVQESDVKDMISFEMKEDNLHARMYMLPRHSLSSRHTDMVNMIVQACIVALCRQIKMETLQNAAIIDPLTGCYNRREFACQLKRHIARAVRHKTRLSVFMFDLDHFKNINDTYGHIAGDKVLQTVASVVQQNMRTGDVLARYGGEEFIAVLPETGKEKAMELADRLRMQIAGQTIMHDSKIIRISASFGVAELDRCADMNKIIQDADAMMYRAKLNGRNTVMPGLIKLVRGFDRSAGTHAPAVIL